MLNLALVALLSGSLLTGSPDGDRDKTKSRDNAPEASASVEEAPSLVMRATPADPRAITNLTYAAGRPSDLAPIKAWISYAWGESEAVWAADGETVDYNLPNPAQAVLDGDIVSQRLAVGAQVNFLNFPAFKVGVGGELVAGSNKFQFGEDTNQAVVDQIFGPGTTELSSEFGLQQIKAFLSLRGRVVGVHAGYHFDLADEVNANEPSDDFSLSDGRNALFVGGDFDYPSERFRLFGGADYFIMADDDDAPPGARAGGDNIIWWTMGAGVRFGFVELGTALMIRTQLLRGPAADLAPGPQPIEGGGGTSVGTNRSGGHAGTIAPYLKVAPPALPVSLFLKGAVNNEYTDYGFGLGGANDFKPSLGFTVGLTFGFD